MEELKQLEADLNDSMKIVDWQIQFIDEDDLDEDQTQTFDDQESEDDGENVEYQDEQPEDQQTPKKKDKYAKLLAERNEARRKAELLEEREAYIADLESKLQQQQINQDEDEDEEAMTYQQLAQREAQKVVKELLEQQKKELEQIKTLENVVDKYQAQEYKQEIEKYIQTHKSVPIEDATVAVLKHKAPHLLLNWFDEWTRNRIVWTKNSIQWHSSPTGAETIETLEKQLKESWRR